MKLRSVFEKLIKKFIRGHIFGPDRKEEDDYLGYCRVCGRMVRSSNGRVVSKTDVLHHGCYRQTAPSPGGAPN